MTGRARILYPPIQCYNHFYLSVDNLHEIYVEESGNPDGIPVIYFHGGPGSGCNPSDRQFFDPDKYRIILFDQRGCGRSKPHAELTNNTTQHLVADIEAIRNKLGIDQWLLFGGSWGSTLALVYATNYPDHVLGLILRGIFLCTEKEVSWLFQYGASRIFPDYWQDFLEPIPPEERGDLVQAYYKRLTSENEIERMNAAKHWSQWEARTVTLLPKEPSSSDNHHHALSIARLEAHYCVNKGFLEHAPILENIDRIRDKPGYIIHGRYDMICLIETAFALSQQWSKAKMTVVDNAGHSSREPGTASALVKASDEMATFLKGYL